MKKYTFTVPKTTNKFNDDFYTYTYEKPNSVNKLKSYLADEAVNKYPWLTSTYNTEEYYIPKTKATYTIKFKTKKSYNELFDNINFGTIYDLLYGYSKKYVSSDFIDDYDFKINDTPIRIGDDRIQIGYNIISKNSFKLNDSIKKNIYNIYLNIYNV